MMSMLKGLEGHDSLYSVSEFTDELGVDLSSRKYNHGRVFWSRETDDEETEYDDDHQLHYNSLDHIHGRGIKERIKGVMGAMACGPSWWGQYVIQFWAAKLDGRHHYLTTWDQPFSVGNLHKGLCWYRKRCMDRYCVVEGGGQEDQLGAIGRVFVNKHPESTPDLRLYSEQEFPLRDEAAGCGLRAYFAIPVFDTFDGECYGVLELTSFGAPNFDRIFALDRGLKVAKLRSTHTDFFPISRYSKSMPLKYQQPMESEISKMLELAIKAIPQLHLAQVWVPCKQCANTSNNLSCMERATFVSTTDAENIDSLFEYLQACEFHNLQIGKGITRALMSSHSKSCICKNLCGFGMSENPLVHYAQKARLSLCVALCLESLHDCNDNIYVIEFYFQPNCRKDACGTSSFLHLLLRIMETELKSFKFAMEGQFGEENLSQPNAVEHDLFLQHYGERYSEHDFTNYLQATDSCCLRPSMEYSHGWVFCSPQLVGNLVKEKIELFMIKIASKLFWDSNCLVQFWAPKMSKDRCYLATSDQPYALGCLSKGLALFRKQCINHRYFVDERSNEEEVGPPGRVFRNEYPETTPDLHLYTTREFALRNYAAHCHLRRYSAIPVFDLDQHKWVGVLEFIELSDAALQDIGKALEEVGMSSTNIDFKTSFQERQLPSSVADQSRELALAEVKDTLQLLTNVPQLYTAEIWVPYGECASISGKHTCMELVYSTIKPDLLRHRILHVQTGNGIIGMTLASENKLSFCINSCDISIAEHPLAHYAQQARLDVTFAICLQSSHTGNHLYVLQFLLNQGPSNYDYFCSLLSFLLSILKQKLKSFKLASGQQLEEGLVVDVVEFSEASFSKFDQTDKFPLKFRTVQYSQKGQQQVQCVSDAMDSVTSAAKEKRCYNAAANSKKNAAKKTGLYLTLEHLTPHFGKKLKDVAEDLGVGRSTIKRACREYGIHRWPCNGKYKKNHALFETESACETAQNSFLNVRTTQQLNVQPEADIIIKAKHGDDIIKFQLSLSSGMDKIVEEVATRLNLLTGSFKLIYLDEDNDPILLAHDADLQLCQKSLTAMGKTFLQLFVQLIHK